MVVNREKKSTDAYLRLRRLDTKIKKVSEQIRILDRRMDSLTTRYRGAVTDGRRTFRYTYRLQLATLEGVRKAYYEYSQLKSREAMQIVHQLTDTSISTRE